MDTRASGLGLSSNEATRAAEIEHEIEGIRGNLDDLVSELDQRRHRLSPVRLAREYPSTVALIGGVLLAGVVTACVFGYRARTRRSRSWLARSRRLSQALRQLIAGKPVEKSPGLGWKLLTAAGTATAAVAGRRFARRVFWPKG